MLFQRYEMKCKFLVSQQRLVLMRSFAFQSRSSFFGQKKSAIVSLMELLHVTSVTGQVVTNIMTNYVGGRVRDSGESRFFSSRSHRVVFFYCAISLAPVQLGITCNTAVTQNDPLAK